MALDDKPDTAADDLTPTVGAATDIAPLGHLGTKPAHELTAGEDSDPVEWRRVIYEPRHGSTKWSGALSKKRGRSRVGVAIADNLECAANSLLDERRGRSGALDLLHKLVRYHEPKRRCDRVSHLVASWRRTP